MEIKFFNSLTRSKEIFKPITKNKVGIYCCGPTVYSDPHVGHAKSAITYDLLVRFLTYLGYKVRYVRNITDVGHLVDDADEGEDKIIKRSVIEKIEPMELVEKYMKNYFDSMDILNVLRPNISPRASAHIPEQIITIEKLIKKKCAYESNGSVYFDITKFKDYGKLSKRDIKDQRISSRNIALSEKKHSEDFALWKKADPKHILKWKSPWGYGYPGWHIECSVMSMKYLGETIDIHGGGTDLQFPHHECEIAQSESFTNKKFVNYWLHNSMVTVDGLKMSKSLGNFITIKVLLEKFDPIVIRYFILSGHYRKNLDFSQHTMESAKKNVEKIINTIKNIKKAVALGKNNKDNNEDKQLIINLNNFKTEFLKKLADDLNTPEAIAEIFIFLKSNSKIIAQLTNLNINTLKYMDKIFKDIFFDIFGFKLIENVEPNFSNINLSHLLEQLLALRETLRKKGFFEESDLIRQIIMNNGYLINDPKINI